MTSGESETNPSNLVKFNSPPVGVTLWYQLNTIQRYFEEYEMLMNIAGNLGSTEPDLYKTYIVKANEALANSRLAARIFGNG